MDVLASGNGRKAKLIGLDNDSFDHFFTWGPYADFHGMALTCHIKGSMITAIWTHLRMFQNSKLYQFMLNVEFCLSRCQGAWTVVCTWQYRPWTGSIKPSLQHFQFCRVGLSLGILIVSIRRLRGSNAKNSLVIFHMVWNKITYFLVTLLVSPTIYNIVCKISNIYH
jgi:hypothetical protein